MIHVKFYHDFWNSLSLAKKKPINLFHCCWDHCVCISEWGSLHPVGLHRTVHIIYAIPLFKFSSRSPSLLQRDSVSPTHPPEKSYCLKKDWPTTPALRKHSTAVTRQTLPSHGEYNSTKKEKTTSKMKRLRNHPQSNQQETSPNTGNNETSLQSDRPGVQKRNSENTGGIKRR